MGTFTTPTHTEYITPTGVDRLWSRVPYPRGEVVLIEDGVITQLTVVDSDRFIAAETSDSGAAYTGSVVYLVSGEPEVLLDAAGYLDSNDLLDPDWPAWL